MLAAKRARGPALPIATAGGLAGRPAVVVPGADGLLLAGDWVGPTGMLADAAVASGHDAGLAAVENAPAAAVAAGASS